LKSSSARRFNDAAIARSRSTDVTYHKWGGAGTLATAYTAVKDSSKLPSLRTVFASDPSKEEALKASGGWEYREEVSEVPPKIKDEINKRGYWAGATRAATE